MLETINEFNSDVCCCHGLSDAAMERWGRIKKFLEESCQLPTTQQGSTLPQIAAAEKLCKVYFDIAASCIGEAEVRKRVAVATSSVA